MSAEPVRQLTFDLAAPAAYRAADFLVAPCNAAAARWIERWPDWPGGGLVLHGPSGAGKTHLAHLWAARSGARTLTGATLDEQAVAEIAAGPTPALVVDDADSAPAETALLHLYNMARAAETSLMLVGSAPPERWGLSLPDLRSRLCAMPSVGIGAPDEAILAAVLVKHFSDRQVQVGDDVIDYLIKRLPRAFDVMAAAADALDREALGRGSAVTVPLSRAVLQRLFGGA